jgi:hypothetical protein
LHEEYIETDSVHSIEGNISANSEDCEKEEAAGYIKASLVQFGEALEQARLWQDDNSRIIPLPQRKACQPAVAPMLYTHSSGCSIGLT